MTKRRIIISALLFALVAVLAVSACGGEESHLGAISGHDFLVTLEQGNSVTLRNGIIDMNSDHHRELRGKTIVLNRGANLTVGRGSALYAENIIINDWATLSIEDNGYVEFRGNVTVNRGGSIYVDDDGVLLVSQDVTLNDTALIHDGELIVRGMTKLNGQSTIDGRGSLNLDDVTINSGSIIRNMNKGVMDDVKINGGYIYNGSYDIPDRSVTDPTLSMDYLEVNCGECGVVNHNYWRLTMNGLTMNGGFIENKNPSSYSVTIGHCSMNSGRIEGAHTGCP